MPADPDGAPGGGARPRLTRGDVEEIAALARLALAPDEIDRLRAELAAILDAMAELASVDTDGVPPTYHAVPLELRLRADEVAPSLPAAIALAGAPDRDGDCFRVPHVLRAERP
jgi:aspartyl-tRNA(Asn)/glutamyl-tRNA(Gln) amidotransferase subunit C